MTEENFGARLRRRREERQIALSAIAEQTKIKLSLLEALERDDVSQWPSGIFRRAFVRAYGVAIGLDPDAVVREFLEVHPEPAEDIAAIAAVALASEIGGPSIRLRTIVGSAIGTLSRLRRASAAGEPSAAGGTASPGPPPADAELAVASEPQAALSTGGARPGSGEGPRSGTTQGPSSRTERLASRYAAAAQGRREDEPDTVRASDLDVAERTPRADPPVLARDLLGLAALCTRLGRVEDASELRPLLREAAALLDAAGLIVWVWEGVAEELRPALVHGYSDRVVAQLPSVTRDDDNATAASFRSARMRAIVGSNHSSAALAVPLLAPAGCAGVLALELQPGAEPSDWVRGTATILAAVIAQLVGGGQRPESRPVADSTTVGRGRPVHATPDLEPPRRRQRRRAQGAPAGATIPHGASAGRARPATE
jgi:transcriptional regulator with XRE-family HTH domain